LKTVATFREAYQAHLAKGRLEAEGISAIVLDEYTVGINWMYSQAIGGVKLEVQDLDYDRALKILKEDYGQDLMAQQDDISKDVCPRCGSPSISVRPYSVWWLIPSLLFLVPIFFRRKKWKCSNCGAVW
jgi:ribosomal protein S27AE